MDISKSLPPPSVRSGRKFGGGAMGRIRRTALRSPGTYFSVEFLYVPAQARSILASEGFEATVRGKTLYLCWPKDKPMTERLASLLR